MSCSVWSSHNVSEGCFKNKVLDVVLELRNLNQRFDFGATGFQMLVDIMIEDEVAGIENTGR